MPKIGREKTITMNMRTTEKTKAQIEYLSNSMKMSKVACIEYLIHQAYDKAIVEEVESRR